ncbi:MAG TPA: ABC transporter permease [Dehalococcoidia bacterium]|nr:ABC transporter permease [Dehalococcoidia bacterium]
MQKYVMQRLLLSLPTLVGITVLVFVGLRLFLPASVVDIILGEYGRTDPQLRANIEKELGLSSSIPQQYLTWVGNMLRGDMGKSLHSGYAVTDELAARIPVSVELGLWGLIMALLIAVPTGMFAAIKQDRWPDYGLRSAAILVDSVPSFWVAVLVITFGNLWFGWVPPLHYQQLWEDPIQHLSIMAAPALIIGLTPAGGLIRLVRTQMLEVLRQDYVRTAHAKGLSPNSVFYRHALRNSLLPVVTVIGLTLPLLIAGTVIFENIFLLPGMGRYLLAAVIVLDYPVIQAVNLIFALMLIIAVILVDISYAMLDPRIRFT